MKKKVLTIFLSIVILAGVFTAIILPLSFKSITVKSIQKETAFSIGGINLGKNIHNETTNYASLEVKNEDDFYEKHLKKYTLEDVPTTSTNGFLFVNGAVFNYKETSDNILLFKEAIMHVNDIVVAGFGESGHSLGIDGTYETMGVSYDMAIKILEHTDDRYYLKHGDKYYLKAYKVERTNDQISYTLKSYLELCNVNDKAAWQTHDKDGNLVFEVDNLDMFD